jgi:hypothetical protein
MGNNASRRRNRPGALSANNKRERVQSECYRERPVGVNSAIVPAHPHHGNGKTVGSSLPSRTAESAVDANSAANGREKAINGNGQSSSSLDDGDDSDSDSGYMCDTAVGNGVAIGTSGNNNTGSLDGLDDELFDVSLENVSDLHTKVTSVRWTPAEDAALTQAVNKYDGKNWKLIAEEVPGRTHFQCLQHWRKVLRPGLVKGHWSAKEDIQLTQLVGAAPTKNWASIARGIPGRTAKQCRERWSLNLDPSINRGPWSSEEDTMLLSLQASMGNKWANISQRMPGRTENAVKTRFKSLTRTQDKVWSPEEDKIIIDAKLEDNKRWLTIASLLPRRSRHAVKKRWQELVEQNPELEKLLIERIQNNPSFARANSNVSASAIAGPSSAGKSSAASSSAGASAASAASAAAATVIYAPMHIPVSRSSAHVDSSPAVAGKEPYQCIMRDERAGSLGSYLDWMTDAPAAAASGSPLAFEYMFPASPGTVTGYGFEDENQHNHHVSDDTNTNNNIKSEFQLNDYRDASQKPMMSKKFSTSSVGSLSGYFHNALEAAAQDSPVEPHNMRVPVRADSALQLGGDDFSDQGALIYRRHDMGRRPSVDAVRAAMGMVVDTLGVENGAVPGSVHHNSHTTAGVASQPNPTAEQLQRYQQQQQYQQQLQYQQQQYQQQQQQLYPQQQYYQQPQPQDQPEAQPFTTNGEAGTAGSHTLDPAQARRKQHAAMVSRSASERWRAVAARNLQGSPATAVSASAASAGSWMDGNRSLANSEDAAESRVHMMKKRTSSTPSISWLKDMPQNMAEADAWAASDAGLGLFDVLLASDVGLDDVATSAAIGGATGATSAVGSMMDVSASGRALLEFSYSGGGGEGQSTQQQQQQQQQHASNAGGSRVPVSEAME